MKRHLLIATSIIVAITSCNREETKVDTPIVHEETVWVEFTTGATTKAALQEGDGTHKIVWEENDAISINGETFTVTELSEDNLKATFGANVPVSFTDATEYKAVYPASAGTTFDAISISATPAVIVGGFDDIVAVAYSTDMSLEFRHVTSLIKFQIPSDFPVNEVTISTNEALAGDINVRMSAEDATPEIEILEGKSEITLKGTFTSGDNYYVAVLPGAKTNLTVRFNGYLAKSWDKVVEIGQGRVANMGTLPAPEECGWELYANNNDLKFYKDLNDIYVVKNVILTTSGKFKFHKGDDWVRTISANPTVGKWHRVYKGNDDLNMKVEGSYDVYLSPKNDVVCLINAGMDIPSYEDENKQYHILVEGDWTGLYTWSPSELYGAFANCLDNKSGYVTIKKDGQNDQSFSYWTIPTSENGKNFNFLFRKSDSQSGDIINVTLNADIPCYSNNGFNGSYSLIIYDIE